MSSYLSVFASIIGAVLVAGVSYLFTKWREREAQWRKVKLEYYKEYTASLSGIIEGEDTIEGQQRFALAKNNLNLVAPQAVLQALDALHQATKKANGAINRELHDRLLSNLFYEIRRDMRISPKDDKATFFVGLWASGVPTIKVTQANDS